MIGKFFYAGAFSSLQTLQKHVSKHAEAQYECVWEKLVGSNRSIDCNDVYDPRGGSVGKELRRESKKRKGRVDDAGKCSAKFSTTAAARNHILMRHLNWKGYWCRFNQVTGKIDTPDGNPCTLRYFRTEDMRAHILSYHINYKPHKCRECEFRTTDIFVLRVSFINYLLINI